MLMFFVFSYLGREGILTTISEVKLQAHYSNIAFKCYEYGNFWVTQESLRIVSTTMNATQAFIFIKVSWVGTLVENLFPDVERFHFLFSSSNRSGATIFKKYIIPTHFCWRPHIFVRYRYYHYHSLKLHFKVTLETPKRAPYQVVKSRLPLVTSWHKVVKSECKSHVTAFDYLPC